MTRFEDLPLIEPILRAVREEGYDRPTPIQQQTIRHTLDGRDMLGCAQTGTGKTAAFALPILQRLNSVPAPNPRHVRVLVLSPTRELATQIGDSFARYGRHLPLRHTVVFGGVGQQPQAQALRQGVDILVATPGRLLDLIEQRIAKLDRVGILVLDEADRMLDMGFIHDVRRVIGTLPKKRQTLFFSATLPHDIQTLAKDILTNPVRVEVTPTATTVEKIAQSLYHVDKHGKFPLLRKLLQDPTLQRTLVFTRTKRGANKVAEQLNMNFVKADAIHGNKAQSARERALENFKRGLSRVLVATDIAARGIDVDGVTHVVNYDMPDVPENYVHRIGRTARAGAGGIAIAFCAPDEREELRAVEKLIRLKIPVKAVPAGIAHSAVPTPGAFGSGARPAPLPQHHHPHPQRQSAPPPHAPAPQHSPAPGSPQRPASPPAHPVAGRPPIPRRILWRKRRDR
ncbi:MAG TPA: DEAD/DEAH box helicase [Planctomycetota bacterium]|nr:DEAD/DEAH box helicase [Planctomycetota bacterium]